MTQRNVGGSTYDLTHDAENRMVGVTGGGLTASFKYDDDGNRVQGTVGGVTTTYIGNYYEWSGEITTTVKYYYAGATRIAMRVGDGTQAEGLYWLLSDHLGSTAITTDSSGNKSGEVRYKAWGETRFTSGSTPTTFRFTGQRHEEQLGLYFYNARWYDPALGRFIQADTIVPGLGNSQAWDRYAYALNNPVNYKDETGHCVWDGCLLEIFIIGAGAALIVDYAIQVNSNLDQGIPFWEAVYYENINEQQMVSSAAGGGAGAVSFALIGPSTLGGSLFAGGVSNVVSGRTKAITSATFEQIANIISQDGFNGQQFLNDAINAGLIEPKTIIGDAISGLVVGGMGHGLSRILPYAGPRTSPGGPPIIKIQPGGGITIEISGRPGLYLPPSKSQELIYALLNGSKEAAESIIEEALERSINRTSNKR